MLGQEPTARVANLAVASGDASQAQWHLAWWKLTGCALQEQQVQKPSGERDWYTQESDRSFLRPDLYLYYCRRS